MNNKHMIAILLLTLVVVPPVVYAGGLFFGNAEVGNLEIEDWWNIACKYQAIQTGTISSITVYAGDTGTHFNVAVYDTSLSTALAENRTSISVVHNSFNTKQISLSVIQENYYWLVVSVDEFPENWRYDLGEAGQTKIWRSLSSEYKPNPEVSFTDDWAFPIYASYESVAPEPISGSVMIFTFDDGYASFMEGANILEEYGWKGTFAITPGFVGQSGYLTWDEISNLEDRGHEIASHTKSHWYDRSSYTTQEDIEYELLLSRDVLRMQGLTSNFYIGADTWRRGELDVDENMLHTLIPNYYYGSRSGDRMGRNVPWSEGLVRLMESEWELSLTDLGRIHNVPSVMVSDGDISAVGGYDGLASFVNTVEDSDKLCVMYTHQVRYPSDPEYLRSSMSTSPDNLRMLCDLIQASEIQVMTFGEYISHYVSVESGQIGYYVDDFDDNSIDSSMHTAFSWGTASVEETGGKLVVRSGSNAVHDAGAGIMSNQPFDLTDSFVRVDGGEWCDVALNLMISPTQTLDPRTCDEYYRIYYDGAGNWVVYEEKSGQSEVEVYRFEDYSWKGIHMIMYTGDSIKFYLNDILKFSCPYDLSSTTIYIYLYGSAWHGDQVRNFDNLISNLS